VKFLWVFFALLSKSYPEITELFNNGAILIRRTPTRLLRNAVDFILKQTINAGAAIGSSDKHESHNHDHFSFGKKSYSIRTRIISNILDYIGLNHKENVSKVTKSHRIKKILQSFEFNCGLQILSPKKYKTYSILPQERLSHKKFQVFS
jgi:hypothetical protein